MENRIINLFLYENALRFSEIEKLSKIKSNKMAYHLKSLVKKGVIEKNGNLYKLSDSKEYLIPYLSKTKSVIPVVLVAIKNKKGIFLVERRKRPFKGKLGLPGGRLIMGETIKESVERIGKKFNVNCKFKKINSISMEFVKKNKNTVHSFLLIFATAETKEKIDFMNLEKNKRRIISSDYKLIKKDASKETKIPVLFSKA